MKLWRSRAAWYSAFSERSPCSRAWAIARIASGRAADFKCFNSSSSRFNPSAVIGTLSLIVEIPQSPV
jgi:hypothetical protein